MKGIVLLSGGLDSTLVLLKLLKEGHEVVPMFVDYNQWPLEGELLAYHSVLSWATKYFEKKSWADLYPRYIKVDWHDPQVSERGPGVGSAWGRNIALVGLTVMWAYIHGNDYEFVALGNHWGDVGPDCKPGKFDFYLNELVKTVTKDKLELLLPIEELTVEYIGKELAKFGKELFDLTYSCYWYPPCGYKSEHEDYRCPGCRRKVIAMKAVAKEDTRLYEYFQKRLFGLPNCQERTYQSPLAEKVNY